MKIVCTPLATILFLCIACATFAQTSPADKNDKDDDKASFKFGVNFLNNDVFMGRSDTVRTLTIIPATKYTFKNGIYLSGDLNIIPNRTQNKLDAGEIAAGYDYDITDDFDGSVSFTKLFYNPNSTQISSSISSTLSVNLNYDIAGIITPTISVDYNMIKKGFGNDVFVNAGLTHDFSIKDIFDEKDVFYISPAAAANTGTQNFYDAYLTLKKYKLTAKALAKEAGADKKLAVQKVKLSRFSLLDYEFSAPVEYKTGPLILSFTPTYAITENKLPPRISSGFVASPDIFYFEAGAAVKF